MPYQFAILHRSADRPALYVSYEALGQELWERYTDLPRLARQLFTALSARQMDRARQLERMIHETTGTFVGPLFDDDGSVNPDFEEAYNEGTLLEWASAYSIHLLSSYYSDVPLSSYES